MTSITIDAAVPERVEPAGQVRFTLRRWPAFRLSLRIVVLSIATLGLYRFWGRTRLRRMFWRHLSITGDPLEYTGRPVELLLGFLAVIVILVPLFAIPYVANFMTADLRILGAVNVGQLLVIFYLVPFAVFRARRYLLTRTLWRGIAFDQDGSALRYANLVLRWNLLLVATLGVAYPWMPAACQRYLVAHSWYGDARFGFDGSGRPLLRWWLFALGCFWVAALMTAGAVAIAIVTQQRGMVMAQPVLIFVFLALFLASPVVWAMFWFFCLRYRVREFRHFTRATTLGTVRFESALGMGRVIFLNLVFVLLFALVAAGCIGGAVMVVLDAFNGDFESPVMSTLFTLMVLLPVSWAYFVLDTGWRRVGLLRAACGTLTIHDLDAVEAITQGRGGRALHRGEGLADAFDVGAF